MRRKTCWVPTLAALMVIATGCVSRGSPGTWSERLLSEDATVREGATLEILKARRTAIRYVRRSLRGYNVDAMNAAIPIVFALEAQASPLVPDLANALRHGGHDFLYGSCEFPDPYLRFNAALGLAAIGEPAVPALITLMTEAMRPGYYVDQENVLTMGATALELIGPPAAPALGLLRRLESEASQTTVMEAARDAIDAIEGSAP